MENLSSAILFISVEGETSVHLLFVHLCLSSVPFSMLFSSIVASSSGSSNVLLLSTVTSLELLASLIPLTDGAWDVFFHFLGSETSSSDDRLNVCLSLLNTWSILLFVLLARSDSDLDKLELEVLELFFSAKRLLFGLCSLWLSIE